MLRKIKKYVVSSESSKRGHLYKQVLVALTVGGGCLNYGFHSGWISPMQEVLQSDKAPSGTPLTDNEMTWVASLVPMIAIFAGFFHTYCADAFGRRITLIIVTISQLLSWILLLVSSHIAALMLSRVCAGVGAGGAFIVTAMYIRETMQSEIRGALITIGYGTQYIGILAMYLMGGYLSYYTIVWISFGVSLIVAILLIAVVPETPPYLVKKGKIKEATELVATLRGLDTNNRIVQEELEYMKAQDLHYKTVETVTYAKIFKNKAWRRGFCISFVMFACTGFNGPYSVLTYAHRIIVECGVDVDPQLQVLTVPVLMMCGCIATMIFVDRIGRKPMLIITFAVIFVGMAVIASSMVMKNSGSAFPSFVPVVAMAAIVFVYAMALISIPHLIISEMFKFEIRARIIGTLMAETWTLLSLQVIFFDNVSKLIGLHGVFYIYTAQNIFGVLFIMVFVPETKGRTTEELEDILLGKKIVSSTI